MCGIIGCIAEGRAAAIGLEALRRLEYRGYDSAGIAVINEGRLDVLKDRGRIDEIEKSLGISRLPGDIAILHTRWATHGEPSKVNAHPHTDCNGKIAIVHNGIIENHTALRSILVSEGHVFKSETDSEVIAHLIEKFYKGSLKEAVRKACALLEGAYAIAAVCESERCIVAARRGSPLVLGLGDSMMLASDAGALVGFAKSIIYINDNEICEVLPGSYSVVNQLNESVKKDVEKLTLTLGQIEKGRFKHFMLKEIYEQPDSLRNVLRGRVFERGIKLSIADTRSVKRIIITACGTAWHAALIGKYIIESVAHIPTEVDYASEFRYRNPLVGPEDLVIVISQSGETADTLGALREAKRKGAATLGIINSVGSTISREVDSGIFLHAGPEIGVASTKAFTSQVAALCLLALHIKQVRSGSFDASLGVELLQLPEKIAETLKVDKAIEKVAGEFASSRDFLFLGRGLNFPIALEGAIKMKEISYIHAEGYPAAEMKHGPIALIDKDMPVLFIATGDEFFDKILNNMEEVRSRGGVITAIANEPAPESLKRLAKHIIYVPKVREMLSPIINVVPLQLLAYHIADMKGLDVDKPRNLAKSVTVE